jgi:hypothetical protein
MVNRLGKKNALPGLGGKEGPVYLEETRSLNTRLLDILDIEKDVIYGFRSVTGGS